MSSENRNIIIIQEFDNTFFCDSGERAASNLFHDLRPFLVVELQLCDSLVDAHPSDLCRRANKVNVPLHNCTT